MQKVGTPGTLEPDEMTQHTILEDIGGEIGYTGTTALVSWFGGGNLYVPASISELHPIARAIGIKAAERLVNAWGSETLWIPDGAHEERMRRDRIIATLLNEGKSVVEIARISGIHRRRVQQIAAKMRVENAQENAGAKDQGKNPQEKAPGKDGGAAAEVQPDAVSGHPFFNAA